jgi:hypothetical protein
MNFPFTGLFRAHPLTSILLWVFCGCCGYDVQAADQATDDWIRGNSDNLEMRIRGEILDVDGQPAHSPLISVKLVHESSSQPVDVRLQGHRFEVWLPVHQVEWYAVQIEARSDDAQRRGSTRLMRLSLRGVAVNGLVLTLQPSTRSVKAKIVHDNKPVPHANLIVETTDRTELHCQSDDAGIAEIKLLPAEKMHGFTAWTNDPLFGGFQFDREPIRDESADKQTIELFKCREQKFRVVDGDGKPCSDVEMFLHVATPQPHINFLGSIEASSMVTDRDGNAMFRWFPDWKDVFCYVNLNSHQWVIDGESKWVNGEFVVQVKPRTLRQKAVGKLDFNGRSKAGFCVFWSSFQGERNNASDVVTSVTDQDCNFSADVLPGATYCVFMNDTQVVSDMIDLIPAPTDGTDAATAVLHVQEPEILALSVTAGKSKRAIAYQPVHVRQVHSYQWLEDGKQRSGMAARDRYVYADELGKATAVVESGKEVEVSVYNPDWRKSETLPIVAGQPNSVTMHREYDDPRTIFGVVLQDKHHPIRLDEISIIAGSVDGETRGQEELKLEANGVFRMQTKSVAIGVLATTKDQSMAGVVVAENPNRIMRLYLRPTKQLRGRLVNAKGEPIVGKPVQATLRIRREPENRKLNTFYGFDTNRLTVKTDANGYYTFAGMPMDVEIALSAQSSATRDHWLGTTKLVEDEAPDVQTHTINEKSK